MGSEKSSRYAGVDLSPYFDSFESQLKQNLVVRKYVTNFIQNHDKIDDVITSWLYLHHSLFWGSKSNFLLTLILFLEELS